jgi:hypothetical protein
MLGKWFHHLFTPHCDACDHDKQCKNCELVRELLEEERFTNKQLLNRIIELTAKEPEVADRLEPIKFEEVKPRTVSWKVKRELLEQEDRARARALNELKEVNKLSIEDLEKELGVDDAGKEREAI